jgi:hypothetical protein
MIGAISHVSGDEVSASLLKAQQEVGITMT